jgi:hypothetical protein
MGTLGDDNPPERVQVRISEVITVSTPGWTRAARGSKPVMRPQPMELAPRTACKVPGRSTLDCKVPTATSVHNGPDVEGHATTLAHDTVLIGHVAVLLPVKQSGPLLTLTELPPSILAARTALPHCLDRLLKIEECCCQA